MLKINWDEYKNKFWIIYVLIVTPIAILFVFINHNDLSEPVSDYLYKAVIPGIAVIFSFIRTVKIEKSSSLRIFILNCILLFIINWFIYMMIFILMIIN
jgi:hypothetical protein